MSEQITVLIRNGKIIIDFSKGNPRVNSINLASRIKRLPDVDGATVHAGGNITVKLSSVRNIALLQRQIADLANGYTQEATEATQTAQLSLF